MPLGSGAYRIKEFDAGRSITYERVKDYWAKDLPVAKGQWNFDEIKLTYFLDRTPAFEEFKSGQARLLARERRQAVGDGLRLRRRQEGLGQEGGDSRSNASHPCRRSSSIMRRKQFQDPRVRKAFNLAFNFEEANKKLFYDLYVRVKSYFDNSELAATGLPQGRELEILNEVRDEVPPEVFTTEWKNPVKASPEAFREHMREASKLLADAGWKVQELPATTVCGFFCKTLRTSACSAKTENVLRNDAGETSTAEFLLDSPDFEHIVLPYVQDLQRLGIKASVRMVDSAQYKRREDAHDYDIIVDNFPQSESPGNEQRDFWGSAAADKDGSTQHRRHQEPGDRQADRQDRVLARTAPSWSRRPRALDRVLLWNYYVGAALALPL